MYEVQRKLLRLYGSKSSFLCIPHEAIRKTTKRNCNDSFLIPTNEIRFSNGEGKVKISETVRGSL